MKMCDLYQVIVPNSLSVLPHFYDKKVPPYFDAMDAFFCWFSNHLFIVILFFPITCFKNITVYFINCDIL